MLVPLAEGTEEFRDTVRHFYATLAEFHSKIRLVKVGKGLAGAGACGPRRMATAKRQHFPLVPSDSPAKEVESCVAEWGGSGWGGGGGEAKSEGLA